MIAPRFLLGTLAIGLLAGGLTSAPATAVAPAAARTGSSAAPAPARQIAVTRWGVNGLSAGTFEHARNDGGLVVGRAPTRVTYRDPYGHQGPVNYERGRWYSPWVRPGFGLEELIASYNAKTPTGTFIEISVRGRVDRDAVSSWDSLGRWASHDTDFHRMSLGSQDDDFSSIAVDTLVTDSGVSYRAWQLRVSLLRVSSTHKTPVVTRVGAMASRLPSGDPERSQPRGTPPKSLHVPKYSQVIHDGEYPQWNGGGEAWCSPTSTAMVVAYWNRGPTRKQYSWVKPEYRDPWVDYAARNTYASGYDGTGDWPFNTAYAANFGLDAFVTRLRSLRDAELLIQAGIPLVASISFGKGELDGAPIDSTDGHLVVIRGFTANGRVIVNDPAAPNNKTVHRVYERGQFERAWVGASGGVVYVIHPASKALPDARHHSNW